MDSLQNILSTFTAESDTILSEIMVKYKLEEAIEELRKKEREGGWYNTLVLTKTIMNFSRGKISEKEFIESTKEDLNISQQTAEQVVKEIIKNLIPTLGKPPEERKKMDIPAKIKPIASVSEILPADIVTGEKPNNRSSLPPKKLERIKKPIASEEIKKTALQTIKRSEPDNYRELIE